jgi:hypothetical protein
MDKNKLAIFTLLIFLNFIICCTTTEIKSANHVPISPTLEIQAKKFPEVELTTSKGNIHKGKIISLRGEDLLLSPFPYWNVELLKINMNEIHYIKLLKKKSKATSGMLSGFAWTFIIIGILAGAGSRYDEDYEEALLGSAVTGAVGGLIGFAIGGIAQAGTKSEYEFFKMPDSKKVYAIKKIMGY